MGVRKLLFYKEGVGTPFIGDVIEHEGKSWLVPDSAFRENRQGPLKILVAFAP